MRSLAPRSLALLTCATLLALGAGAALTLPSARAGERKARLAPKEEARIELGRRLFFDPLVSRSGARACASCHDPEHGFSDSAPRSRDDMGLTRRHSQTLIDGALNPSAHWDGEFQNLEVLVTARLKPVSNGKGMLSHGAAPEGAAALPATTREPGPGTPGTSDDGDGGDGDDGGGGGDDDDYPPAARAPGEPEPAAKEGAEAAPPPATSDGQPAAPPAAPAAPAPKPPEAKPGEQQPAENKAPAKSEPSLPPEEPDPEVVLDIRKLPRVDVSVEHAGRYREAFVAAYGSPAVNVARIADAIAAYSLTIESSRSRYDRFVAGEADMLTTDELRGLELFRGRARCAECHKLAPAADGRAPFSDYAFHNTGVAFSEFAREAGLQTLRGVVTEPDKGRERVSTRPQDRRAFKTPSLRDVAERGPWFHDGSAKSLEAAVHYYAQGGSADAAQSDLIGPLTLTEGEVTALVAFLKALSGETRAGLAPEAWSRRANSTELTFVDSMGRRMPGLTLTLEAAGDVLPGWNAAHDASRTLVTDERGRIVYEPVLRTHVRLRLPDGLVPLEGGLVPDTCASARIQVPVDGRLRVLIETPATTQLPPTLAAEHVGAMVLPGHPVPRTLLSALGAQDGPPGRKIAAYAGWRRTDVPSGARLLLPGLEGRMRRVKLSLAGPVTTVTLP